MTGSSNASVCVIIATNGAGVGSITIRGTSGLGNYRNIVVTGVRSFIIGVRVAAAGAGISGVTVLGTSGGSYNCYVGVSSFNFCPAEPAESIFTGIFKLV